MQRYILIVILLTCSSLTTLAEDRIWKDATGSFSVKAEFVQMSGKTVQLRREDGKLINVPFERLSKADQEYIRNQNSSAANSFDSSVGSYIHPDFCAAFVIHPKQIADSSIGKTFRIPLLLKALAQTLELDSPAITQALDPSKISRVTLLIEPFPGGNVAFFPAAIVEFNEEGASRQAVRALWPNNREIAADPELISIGEKMAGVEIQSFIADSRTLLIAPTSMMKLMRSKRQASTNILRSKIRRELDDSDICIAYVSRPVQLRLEKLTGMSEQQLREDPETDDFVKTLAMDVNYASAKLRLTQSPSVAVAINCSRQEVSTFLEETIISGVNMLKAAISTQEARSQLKQELGQEFPPSVLAFVDSTALKQLVDAIKVAKRGRTLDLSIKIPNSILVYLEKTVDKVVESVQPIDDNGKWHVIFRSNDPRIWNTDVNKGPSQFAMPLARVPEGIKFLRLKMDNEKFVIIQMNNRDLGRHREYTNVGWVGTNLNKWNGRHLGIYNKRWTDEVRGSVHIWPLQNRGIRGWGFGNHVKLDDGQSFAWAGKTIGKTVFEFSVKSGELTASEKRALLK